MININKTHIYQFLIVAAIAMLFSVASFAQATYSGNNSATARGSALGKTVNDYSNSGIAVNKANDAPTVINFPMIGVGKTASTPVFQTNGSYNIDYVITVKNFGQYALQGVQVTDILSNTFPSPMTFSLRSAVTISGGTGLTVNAAFNGTTNTGLLTVASSTLAIGATRTITIPLNVVPNGSFGVRNNTATATATTADNVVVSDVSNNTTNPDGNGNGTPFDDATPTPITLNAPDINVNKIVSNATPNVNTNVTFTITAQNIGTGSAASVVINDLLPAGYEYVSHTQEAGTTYDQTTGAWAIGNRLVGSAAVQLQVVAKVLPNKLASEYQNTASSNYPGDSDNTNNSSTPTVTPVQLVDLKVTNTDGLTAYLPGATHTYTIVVENEGVSNATASAILATLPAGSTWTAVFTGGATGNANGTGSINENADIPAGAKITYTVTVPVPANQTGDFSITATASHPNDANTTNNTAIDKDLPSVDLKITNTDGVPNYIPGATNTYTVVATNVGPAAVTGATVQQTLPAGATWTATFSGGATGIASGSGSISQSINLPPNGVATYTVLVPISAAQTGNWVTTATIAAPITVEEIDLLNNSSTDTDLPTADLSITNTDNKISYNAGDTHTYTVVVANAGPGAVVGARVEETLPAGSTWTAVLSGGATGSTSGNGSINQLVDVPSGATITYTVTVPIPATQTGNFELTATVTAPNTVFEPNLANNTATDVDVQNADLSITNTDGKATYTAGEKNIYTVVVTNNGPIGVDDARVTYAIPAGTTGTWTAVTTGGAVIPATTGTGAINQVVDLPNGATITYTFELDIPSDYTGNATTTAQVAMPAGYTDPNLANNTATDTDTSNRIADLAVTNTDGKTTYTPGTTNTYTFVVTNGGPSDAPGSSIVNTLPAGVTGTWTAVYAGGATGTANGTGSISETTDIPSGGSVTYTYVVDVPSDFTGNFVNTATATTASGITDPTPANNTATDTDTQASVTDLSVIKVASSLSPVVDSQITFTIEAKNFGPSQANGVTVTDLLSSGYTFISANTNKGSYTANNGIWTIGQMAPNSTGTLTIVARVNANQSNYQNQAVIAGLETDPITTNNTSSVTPVPVKLVDLAITQTISTTTPDHNGLVTMTLTATNLGPSHATGVQVADLIKAGFTLVTNTPSKGTYDAATGIWTLGGLNAGETQTLVFTARVNATAANSDYINTAVISGTETETTLANNTASVTVVKPPMANNDSGTTIPNTPVVIDILANDVPGGVPLRNQTVTITTQPLHGTLMVDPITGKVTYTPALNYYGPDEFYYTVTDANGAVTNIAKVTIDIKDNPKIGVAKQLVSSTKAVNGSYNIVYRLTVGNYGVAPLNQVSIKDDLRSTFLGHTIRVTNIKSLGTLQVNTAFNGSTDIETLSANNSLAVGQKEQIEFTVNVTLNNSGSRFLNIANAEGTSVTGLKTTDVSTNGLNPTPNDDGNVSPSEPTPVDLERPKEFIPGGFSPNGDGTNDRFVIENTGFKRLSLEVFNRWGNRVYRSNDYKNDWDGRCTEGISVGQDLPEGTYFYIVILDGKEKFVGHITLKR